ncbi:hypothetical protein [Halomonas lysinitropha]|uniref:Glycosyltransferase n=1 Tax=Halomonas lysinitropha TaxID=2607506 RepID=A0A5K1IBL7_9GAMM|nr:hypothetical protein [Halomonas lysinitropha]VVZ95759.1 hypothetical protein HALO32_01838 [Halomonas lysinitropha]
MTSSTTVDPATSKPSRILFFPLGWVLAHTLRCIEIARVLRQRGHEVVFTGDDPRLPDSRLHLVEEARFREAADVLKQQLNLA